jgi:hypothetical protein
LDFLLEQCAYCLRTVVDESGKKTADFGIAKAGKYICGRCLKALEFALGG